MIVAYLALFAGVGIAFLFVNLLVGHFVRPSKPNREKLEVYECGEPTIGSSFVQFDLRFYVVALLFIIFDVEVAFFFPWAVVFGKATHLMDPQLAAAVSPADRATSAQPLTSDEADLFRELGVPDPQIQAVEAPSADATWDQSRQRVQSAASSLAWMSLVDIAAFFAVLLVGFAYVWKRGDLDWVRAIRSTTTPSTPPLPPTVLEEQPALSA